MLADRAVGGGLSPRCKGSTASIASRAKAPSHSLAYQCAQMTSNQKFRITHALIRPTPSRFFCQPFLHALPSQEAARKTRREQITTCRRFPIQHLTRAKYARQFA